MAKTHYIYGSGSFGCLYDYGPNYAATVEDAIDGLLCVFSDLSEDEESELKAGLADGNSSHHFHDKHEAGADYCEVSACDCDNPGEHDDDYQDADGYTVSLDNLDDREGAVMVTASGSGAGQWAKRMQSIGGSMWERDGSDFAYAMPTDHPGLVAELEAEGYVLNLDDYSPPSER